MPVSMLLPVHLCKLVVNSVSEVSPKVCFCGCSHSFECAHATSDSQAAPTGLLFFELMFVTFRTLFVALFTWPEEMLIIKKVGPCSML